MDNEAVPRRSLKTKAQQTLSRVSMLTEGWLELHLQVMFWELGGGYNVLGARWRIDRKSVV